MFDEIEREYKRRLTVEIRRTLTDVPFVKDIVVTDPEEIENRGGIVGTVLYTLCARARSCVNAPAGRCSPGPKARRARSKRAPVP